MFLDVLNDAGSVLKDMFTTMEEGVEDDEYDTEVDLKGLIGAPPCFSELADFKTKMNPYGREYMKRFIEDGNFVAIQVGMPKLNVDEDLTTEAIVQDGMDMDLIKSVIATIQDSPNDELFSFDPKMGLGGSGYWDDVNNLSTTCARIMGVDDYDIGIDLRGQRWQDYQSKFLTEFVNRKWNYVSFYNDGIIEASENLSHTVGPTTIEENINNSIVTNNPVSDTAGEIAMLTGQDIRGGIEAAERYGDNQGQQEVGLMQKLKGFFFGGGMGALNIKMDLPDIWQDTNYSKDYNLKFKLTTPHGNPLSVYLNIVVPMCHILPLISARQFGFSNTYNGGYVLKIFCKGMLNCDMGMATSVSIERNQESVSIDGLPTEIDVTITVTDLHPMLALPYDMSQKSIAQTEGLMGYLGTLCGYNSTYFTLGEAAKEKAGQMYDDTLRKATIKHLTGGLRGRANEVGRDMSRSIINKFF